MAGFNQALVDGAYAVVRAVEHHARQEAPPPPTSLPSSSPSPSPTSSLSSAVSSTLSAIASSTLSASQSSDPQSTNPAETDNPQQGDGGAGGSNPLLFFVALGFGVVFTNLW